MVTGRAKEELDYLKEDMWSVKTEKVIRESSPKKTNADRLREYDSRKILHSALKKGNDNLKNYSMRKPSKEDRKNYRSFQKKVESQNVSGIIPEVEERGLHHMVVHDPFSSPEKVLIRDRATGLLSVNNSDRPARSIFI